MLAQKFDSCIEGFPLRPAVADLVAMDPDSGLTMVAVKENDAEMVRQAEMLFRSFMDSHQRRRSAPATAQATLSWAWLNDAPSGHDFVGSYGRVFDMHRAGAAGRRMAKPVHDHAGIRVVRERPPGADRTAEFAALARHQCPGRLE